MTHMEVPVLKKTKKILPPLFIGFVVLFLCILPTLILGGDGVVIMHDQLDIDVPFYKLSAKHFGDSSIPEFMDGLDNKAAVNPPSFATLLLYMLFSAEIAFTLNKVLIQIVAFVCLYLLLREWKVNSWISVFSGLIYCLLPFYSDFGLNVMGRPLLFYVCSKVFKGEQKWWHYLIVAFFAAASSPFYSGYADCTILFLTCIILFLLNRGAQAKRLLCIFLILVVIYIVIYSPLIFQTFLGQSYVSHRSDWGVGVAYGWSQWVQYFLTVWRDGMYHAVSNHTAMVPWVLATAGAGLVMYVNLESIQKNQIIILSILIFAAAAIAAFYATWRYGIFAIFRREFGGVLKTFQGDRFWMLYPAIWYSAFGLVLHLLWTSPNGVNLRSGKIALSRIVSIALCLVLAFSTAISTYNNSQLKGNIERLQKGIQPLDTSFNHFYSTELFEEIKNYIGRPQEEYRVGSVALYPSVPLYNGFYCIDGYSTNYDIEYKHSFREIISAELDKNDTIRTYFDSWGSRCYLFSSEIGQSYYFLKNSTRTIKNLQLNHDVLVSFGCEYVFSGLEIENYANSGLVFLNTFENDESPYRIWLYQVA